jgi:Icc-related predicted phosphoesterase
MSRCLFVSDLHGSRQRYEKLFERIAFKRPEIVLLGGDLLPFGGVFSDPGGRGAAEVPRRFLSDFFLPRLEKLRAELGRSYPLFLVILGNDDPRCEEEVLAAGEGQGLLRYLHDRKFDHEGFSFYGYACVPPTPFLLKDWERYDVSRYTDVGAVSPLEGWRSVPAAKERLEAQTIQQDLVRLTGEDDLSRGVFLFHAPPYQSSLDRAALDGRMVDGAPMDVHVGSIAVRRFIEERKPYLTLHGHVHESARLTGSWSERIGGTLCFSAAHDGPELAAVEFSLKHPEAGKRSLL